MIRTSLLISENPPFTDDVPIFQTSMYVIFNGKIISEQGANTSTGGTSEDVGSGDLHGGDLLRRTRR